MTVSQYIINFLTEKKVRTVFAYPGANVLRLYSMLCESGIRLVLTRHEQGAIHAATGYAKSTGKMGVCIATSGPGATNLVTGVADAYLDSSPVLVITGQVPSKYIGRDAFQEADIMGITIPVTKHNYLIRQESEIPRDLEEAWRVALSPRQGPVLVDITSDLFDRALPDKSTDFECVLPRERGNTYPFDKSKSKIKKAIAASFRPLILAGGGIVSDSASDILADFSRESRIPVVTTMMGQGISHAGGFPFLGMAGTHGVSKANTALTQCDLLIAIGCRFSDRTITDFDAFPRSRTVIHCDIDPAEINKNISADIPVVCSAREFLTGMLEIATGLDKKVISCFSDWQNVLIRYDGINEQLAPFEKEDGEADSPVYRACGDYQKSHSDSYIITDVGTVQTKAARTIQVVRERAFVTTGGLGAMGFGIPAAIGASFAVSDWKENLKNTKVILICGDGGFQMTMQEIALIKDCPVPVKIIIVNNMCLKMVSLFQSGRGGLYELPNNPDFTVIASAYNIPASLAGEDIYKSVSDFLTSPDSGLLEVRV